jgi:hypothetical protein
MREKSDGKRPLGRPSHKWEDNIKMVREVIEWKGMGWVYQTQDRDQWRVLANTVMNLLVP